MDELKKAYLLLQENCGIKVGDTVKVLRKADDNEMGWDNEWAESPECMDSFIGEYAKVEYINKKGVAIVCEKADGGIWSFPFFVLEKIAPKWYENIPEHGVLCWLNNNGDRCQRKGVVTRYSKFEGFLAEDGWYQHATPLKKQEIQTLLDNAPEGERK